MKSIFKPLLVAGLLATAGISAFSAGRMGGDCDGPMGQGEHRMERGSPEKMKAYMDKRSADLKAALKITPEQEAAWTTFNTAMKPPADMMAQRMDRAAMEKLTTPERIDKMQAMQTERQASMNQRAQATKTFYATLSDAQKKVFDTNAMHHGGKGGDHKGPRDGHGGKMAPKAEAK